MKYGRKHLRVQISETQQWMYAQQMALLTRKKEPDFLERLADGAIKNPQATLQVLNLVENWVGRVSRAVVYNQEQAKAEAAKVHSLKTQLEDEVAFRQLREQAVGPAPEPKPEPLTPEQMIQQLERQIAEERAKRLELEAKIAAGGRVTLPPPDPVAVAVAEEVVEIPDESEVDV